MKPILQNLVEMTGQRDHLRLEISVLSTLQKLSGITKVRALEIFTVNAVPQMRPRTWQSANDWVSTDEEAAKDPRREPLAYYPALDECISHHAPQAQARMGKGVYTLWLPVWMHDKVTTCLEVSQNRPFSANRLAVITGIFHVYQNYQSLLDYSERDALTGLYNRKTFDEQFSRHTSYRPPNTPLSGAIDPDSQDGVADGPRQQWLAVIDIDHFKQVNDRFGHLYGDEVLILLANILRSSFRSHDRIFRFGGEEFVVLLRSTTQEVASNVFNRFRSAVQEYHFPQVGEVTVSIGFVGTGLGLPVEILGKADQALYHAKKHGRNQVCFYDDLVASGDLVTQVNHEDIELF